MRVAKYLGYIVALCVFVGGCDDQPINSPYAAKDSTSNILYTSFAERPKTLDPARSYSSNEYALIAQIYEPPLQYHYLKRPYELIALTASKMPTVKYFNKQSKIVPANTPSKNVAYSLYTIHIKPGIKYQPHPALAKDKQGKYIYHHYSDAQLEKDNIHALRDFTHVGSRELIAQDYVYQIKRLAHPEAQSPILGLMSEYIVGLRTYAKALQKTYQHKTKVSPENTFIDLREYPLEGVKVIDKYTYQVKIKGKYPQFMYWLAMPFFAPMPWEIDLFESRPGMDDRNVTLDWYPIGTGPYMLTDNNPNRRMILERNPNFRRELYPSTGEAGDKAKGLLEEAGKALPFVDKIIFYLEKETIPRWNKFLQGYYDSSAISSDSFDQAVQMDDRGKPHLTPLLKDRGISLQTSVSPTIYYYGFNMLDSVVGGYSEKKQKLRQAISIILNDEEYISIFLNGRGIPAQGPIPPAIYGNLTGKAGVNPYVYNWHGDRAQRKSLAEAKQLLAQAGYPNGRDQTSGKPLVLNYDVPASSGPDDKARFDWLRKQFAKIGVQLSIRATQYNRFQEKMRNGSAQIFSWGWHADYPDPENFLFLLYGPNSKVKHHGENAANYSNPEFDRLFEQMKNKHNGPQREAIIQRMLQIARKDAPWSWGYHPKTYTLQQQWNRVTKPSNIGNNTLKYARVNPKLRAEKRAQWNQPVFWPIILLFGLFVFALIPVGFRYWRHQHKVEE